MWLIMWFWRLGCASAILEHLVLTTFFNKLWVSIYINFLKQILLLKNAFYLKDYVFISNIIGWIYLITLTMFTQIHYSEVKFKYLNSIDPHQTNKIFLFNS